MSECALLFQHETAKQELADCKKNVEILEVEAKKCAENKEEAERKLTETDAKLRELRDTLAAQKHKDEEYRCQATREKRELEQELMNVQRELQNSVTNSDWIIQVNIRSLAALAQMVACLPLVQQVQGSILGGVVNFHLKIFNLGARRGGDVHFLIARLYITVLD